MRLSSNKSCFSIFEGCFPKAMTNIFGSNYANQVRFLVLDLVYFLYTTGRKVISVIVANDKPIFAQNGGHFVCYHGV